MEAKYVVRPQLFFTEHLSGMCIPVLRSLNGELKGSCELYLCWADDSRTVQGFNQRIQLPTGEDLWFKAPPGIPGDQLHQGWSAVGREAFLGGHRPDLKDLFERLQESFKDFIEFPEGKTETSTAVLALWTMLTYAYRAWTAIPYLSIGGPVASGKTRVLEVLSRVVFRPLPSANLTAPCLFRTLEAEGGTLLLDEAERLSDRSPAAGEILSILLSGYKAGNPARRLTKVGDNHQPRSFDVFGPKAIVAIASLPGALASRCIQVIMFRAPRGSASARRQIDEDKGRWRQLRDDLHCFSLSCGQDILLLAGRTDLCTELAGRDNELWQPIVGLAHLVETAGVAGLTGLVTNFAVEEIACRDNDAPEAEVVLLRCLAHLVSKGQNNVTPEELLSRVRRKEASLFSKWGPRGVSNALSRYGLRTYRSHGRRTYSKVTLPQLQQIEMAYELDLGISSGTCGTWGTSSQPFGSADEAIASARDAVSGIEEAGATPNPPEGAEGAAT